MPDLFVPRPVQNRMITAILNMLDEKRTVNVWDVHPGSGKTLGVSAAINELYRRGLIDAVAIYTPRLNLCYQFEFDWKNACDDGLFASPHMGGIFYMRNEPPLIRDKQFGYVSTYQSLNSDLSTHYQEFRKRPGRIALVADEAQILGVNASDGGAGTESAKNIEILSELASVVIIMSGTPNRSDGLELLFGKYTEADDNGIKYLEADVQATYFEGVAEGYLRPFEYELFDGEALYEYFAGGQDELVLSEMTTGLAKVLEHRDFWEPIVDRTIEVVRDMQTIDNRFCGLIGAANQNHAKKIIKYLENKGVRALLAVSDENLSQDNLRSFKNGGYDILVTVAMAHMGYDHKPITVVTCLNAYRSSGWLDQFFARGMRVMDDIPIEQQTVRCLVPADPMMVDYVENKRDQSQRGLREKESRTREDWTPPVADQEQFGEVVWAEVTDIYARGMDAAGDLSPDAYREISQLRKQYNLGAVNYTGLNLLLIEKGISIAGIPKTEKASRPKSSQLTEDEKKRQLRKKASKMALGKDRALGAPVAVPWGYFLTRMKNEFNGKALSACSREELEQRISWLNSLEV